MSDVTEAQVIQLAKILAMLGTDNPHERAAFAGKAHQFVSSRGISWQEMLLPPAAPTISVNVKGGPDWEAMANRALKESQMVREENRRLQRELADMDAKLRAAKAAARVAEPAASPMPPPHNPHKPGFAAPWAALCVTMLTDHLDLVHSKEQVFLADQIARHAQWGTKTTLSPKQEAWMRGILERAGLSW